MTEIKPWCKVLKRSCSYDETTCGNTQTDESLPPVVCTYASNWINSELDKLLEGGEYVEYNSGKNFYEARGTSNSRHNFVFRVESGKTTRSIK